MAKDVKIPDIGGFEGVEVIDVLVAEGDSVEKEDSLITLESDKAAMDVPAPFAGTVKELKVKAGDKVSEGDVIVTVEEGGEDGGGEADEEDSAEADEESGEKEKPDQDEEEGKADKKDKKESDDEGDKDEEKKEKGDEGKARKEGKGEKGEKGEKDEAHDEKESKAEEKPAPADTKGSPPTVDHISQVSAHAGPSVRKFARELGVDLSRVEGSGYKERITHEDVKRFVKSALRGGGGGAAAGGALPAVPEVDFSRFGEIDEKPLSRIKRISGPRLQAAWVNAPHVTQHDEADTTALEAVRKGLNENAGKDDAKLTPLAFLVRAVVLAMQAYPDFNASLASDGETLICKKYFHIGFAVDTEGGLLVPVIRDADKKNLREIADELARLAEAARSGKLKRDEMEGGCFSISSLGGIGGTAFTPIVNAPEVAVLGVSRAEMKPKWNGSEFAPRLMLPLSLSYDHRVIDGAQAVRFTRHLAQTLETLRGFVS
ncbi:MAG: 2-oxo acid dehydrogenase subunit E2 [Gammaproteobacteria bacterium]